MVGFIGFATGSNVGAGHCVGGAIKDDAIGKVIIGRRLCLEHAGAQHHQGQHRKKPGGNSSQTARTR